MKAFTLRMLTSNVHWWPIVRIFGLLIESHAGHRWLSRQSPGSDAEPISL